jgi:perosamine synthetase
MNKIKYAWSIPDIGEEERLAADEVLKSGWISGTAPYVELFEKEFAKTVKAKYAVAVCNGTAALILGLIALRRRLNPTPGEKMTIVAPTWTYIATANTARFMGRLKLVDCGRDTFCMKISGIPKSDIVMPVDIGGCPAEYDDLKNLAWNPIIFADSAEAMGSRYRGKPIGSQALLHMFSLHATKIITTGEGGMLTTDDQALYEDLKALNNQGHPIGYKTSDYEHPDLGFNFRMPAPQAAIGLVQLKKLPGYLKKREEFANIYSDIIGDRAEYQFIPSYSKSCFFLFTILVHDHKIKFMENMLAKGIQTKSWKPVHMQPCYGLWNLVSFPNAEDLYKRNVHLPIHNKLSDEDVKVIAETAKSLL